MADISTNQHSNKPTNDSDQFGFMAGLKSALLIKKYPVNRIKTTPYVILLYTVFLNTIVFIFFTPIILSTNPLGFIVLIFTTITTLGYLLLAGLIFSVLFRKELRDYTVENNHVLYLIMYSILYFPLGTPLFVLVEYITITPLYIFAFLLAVVSQYFIIINSKVMLREANFKKIFFIIVNCILQFGFMFLYVTLLFLIYVICGIGENKL